MSLVDDHDRKRLRALSHPVRLRILSLLTGATKSSTELARDLDMSQAAVSFHVRQLADAGLIDLAEVRSVRGGQERRYRSAADFEGGADVDVISSATAASAEIRRRLIAEQPPSWDLFSDADLWVDPEAWLRCVRTVANAMKRLHGAAAAEAAPGAIHISATTMMFSTQERPKQGSRPHAAEDGTQTSERRPRRRI